MSNLSRQEAMALGLKTHTGRVCNKHPHLNGLRRVTGACTGCAADEQRKRRAANPEKTKAQRKKANAKYMKSVRGDQDKLALHRSKQAAYRFENKARIRAAIAQWSSLNPQKVKLYSARVKSTHRDKVNASTAARRAAKLHRTPRWLSDDDKWLIDQIYGLAALRTKILGFPWHVDHIIPLQGRIVSGLHTPYNLQVIPGVDNSRKGARFSPRVVYSRSGQARVPVV